MARERHAGRGNSRKVLPRADAPPHERADAARNRVRILDAAARLFATEGVDAVSMDAVAAAAGVGKGTLFRRFGDKSGLAAALIDDRERRLQQRMLTGPPPLGPGASADERVAAFVSTYLRHLAPVIDVVRLSETAAPMARFRIGSYRFWHRHLELLATDAGAGDPRYVADALLALLAADLVTRQRARGMSWTAIRRAAEEVARRLLA
jgi:AcrR family transcriptional regulator